MAWHKLINPHHGFSWTQLNLKFIYVCVCVCMCVYIYIFPPPPSPYLTHTLGVLIGPCHSVTSELLPLVLPSPCKCNCLLDLSIWVILKLIIYKMELATFSCGSAGKESTCNAGDLGWILGLGRFPGEGKGYPLQYSGLENSMDCVVHGIAKSQTRLSDFHFHLPLKMYFMLPFLSRIEQKYVFTFPPLSDRVSETLGICPALGASFVIPEGALSTTSEFMLTRRALVGPGNFRRSAGHTRKTKPVTKGLERSFPHSPPTSTETKSAGDWVVDYQSCLPSEIPETQKNSGIRRLGGTSWLVDISVYQEDGAPQLHRGQRLLRSGSFHIYPMCHFIWLFICGP